MPFDAKVEFEKAVARLADLAMDPACIDHARYEAKRMEADPCGLYVGLAQAVKQRLDALKGGK